MYYAGTGPSVLSWDWARVRGREWLGLGLGQWLGLGAMVRAMVRAGAVARVRGYG